MAAEVEWRVTASEIVGWIDRLMRNGFGFAGKIPPEKLSGGGDGGRRIQAARDRQKSYADLKRKPMEFQVGDRVMLKVSPWKWVVHFGKRGKLNPRYVRPFKVLKKIGSVAYKLELPQELSRVHNTFHVSNLKKCYSNEPLVVPLEGLHVDDKLQCVEEPVEIMEREVKRLKRSRIPLVKVRWNSRRGPEFTWERQDLFKKKYPHLFTNRASSSTTTSMMHKVHKIHWDSLLGVMHKDFGVIIFWDDCSDLESLSQMLNYLSLRALYQTISINGGAVDWKSKAFSLDYFSCYTDDGYLTDADDLKCQTGYVFILNGGVVDWKSAKQSTFATLSAEAEYIAAYDASKEAVWIKKFIFGLGMVPTIEEPINMYCDNTGAIAIAKESGIIKGASHFRAKVHYLREVIEFGDIKLEKVHTDDNIADPFTKALAFPKHSEHAMNIGMLLANSFMQVCDDKYCLELLHEFGLLTCRHVLTPLPENIFLAHNESEKGKFLHMHAPLKSHLDIALRLLKYLKLAPGNGIQFLKRNNAFDIKAFSDFDWAKCPVTRMSVFGYSVFVNGCLVSWKSKNMRDLNVDKLLPAELHSDNKSAMQIAANRVMHEKTKHFDLDVHLVREKVSACWIKTVKVDSKDNVVDILTKALSYHSDVLANITMILRRTLDNSLTRLVHFVLVLGGLEHFATYSLSNNLGLIELDCSCCGLDFRVLNVYDQKSFDEERGLNCVVQTSLPMKTEA
ncbi:hypothetical protein Tco_0016689 [Tanacetum coccineum]